MDFIQFIFLIFFYIPLYVAIDIDPSKTLVWGPGLNPQKVVMRARYFFLQLRDYQERNITKSPGKNIVFASIKGRNKNNQACRIWAQTLDCDDGSFIVRYRVYETCYNFEMSVRVKDLVLTSASKSEKGPIYEEECNCPHPSLESWMTNYECPESYSQIEEDLKIFPEVDFDKIRADLIKTYHKPHSYSFCHYVIKNNKIYRKCYGQHVGFNIFSDSILLSLSRKVHLPDSEFFMNLGDWPLVPKNNQLYPIFSWCGSDDTNDIVLPTYDLTESSLENMGRVMLDVLSVQGNIKTPWEKKIEKVFWRGRDSRRERLDLIDIARENPELFNVSITNFFFFKNEMEKYGPGERHISFFDFFKYKYQLNIDGTVAAYRQPYLLAGDSLVFKQTSKYYEFFYHHLIPHEHYVPVNHNLSDLVEKVKWAKANDDIARKIAKNGRELIRQVALPRDVLCYYVSLLKEWSQRMISDIKVLDGMEPVGQPNHVCDCHSDEVVKPSLSSKTEL
ncbi:protein O-glucosyltransferase 2-like [Chelonus insularis]|uniref:protein O-glucosyltransferase 2-like n=1 Tax=Chelonus insularis TaxID=460826 RepID=UPI00158AEE91|nr:protein O-glucosyltransferase 2-like [Chelonus insularis]